MNGVLPIRMDRGAGAAWGRRCTPDEPTLYCLRFLPPRVAAGASFLQTFRGKGPSLTLAPRVLAGFCALALTSMVSLAQALPQRSLVARPLPPAVLSGTNAGAAEAVLSQDAASRLADSLLTQVAATRDLRLLNAVPVRTLDQTQVRQRLEEITREDQIDTQLRQEERLFEYLELLPRDSDLVKLYHDLLEEQLAGFYDIDRRELVLAGWLPLAVQADVVNHELTHALQDQHFSLRVRKRLGFSSTDAEAAWNALIEGDATAVMLERALAGTGRHFTALPESASAIPNAPASIQAASGPDSPGFRAAPKPVGESLGFPYLYGVRFVEELFKNGGWRAVDNAFVHPPESTEQVLHPERFLMYRDAPIDIQIPELAAILGEGYRAVSTGVLGEHDLGLTLRHFIDPEIAAAAVEGWGGCSYALFAGPAGEPDVFVLVSEWDSEDDAIEFFGGWIGAVEARFPEQVGYAEASSQDQILWNLDADAKRQNVLRLKGRQVSCIESVPSARLVRILQKLDVSTRITDPTPESRTSEKQNLPWNLQSRRLEGGVLTMHLPLPAGWSVVEVPSDTLAILEAVRGPARLVLGVDRTASNDLGSDGYAHVLADILHARGKDVYVQTDVVFPRPNGDLYEHVFVQTEGREQINYYLAVTDLGSGYGYLQISGPANLESPDLHTLFYDLLAQLERVREDTAATSSGAGAPANRSKD